MSNSSDSAPICYGNWKCNGSFAQLADWARAFEPGSAAAGLFVPYPYLHNAASLLAGKAAVGSQDLAAVSSGAYTGSVSAQMVADCGATHALVGHSESRQAGQNDEDVAARLKQACANDLEPVVCIGESWPQREAGELEAVLSRQLAGLLADLAAAPKATVAYEPVWAIGTGKAASAADAQQACLLVRKILDSTAGGDKIPILYGGSVKADNAAQYLANPAIDGLLVGGASLDAAEFSAICRTA